MRILEPFLYLYSKSKFKNLNVVNVLSRVYTMVSQSGRSNLSGRYLSCAFVGGAKVNLKAVKGNTFLRLKFFKLSVVNSTVRREMKFMKYNVIQVSQTWGFYLRFCLYTNCYSWIYLIFFINWFFVLISETIEVVGFSVRFSSWRWIYNYCFYGENMYLYLNKV